MKKLFFQIVVLSAVVGAIIGVALTYFILSSQKDIKKSSNELIYDFYQIENAVHISPHSLRRMMDKGDKSYILVDLRSPQEYEKEHIIGAINIPAYTDPDTSAYEEVDRIVSQFKQLPEGKEVIVYCYSMPCMTGRKIGLMLAEKGIFVKLLGIGWNEWRYFWTLWNHEHEWNLTKTEDYIFAGSEPGTPAVRELPSPCGEGQFSC